MTTGGRERTLVKLQIGHESEMFDRPQENGHTHRWTCFVRPISPLNFTDRSFISKVKFNLHESYKESTRTVRDPPFEITETGYGSFPIQLEIYFNYPGAKAFKYIYDMLIQIQKKGQASEEATFELKDAPSSFAEMAKKYGAKRKRSGGADEASSSTPQQQLFPPQKVPKADATRSPREALVKVKERKEEDRFTRELRLQEKERRERDKERERKRERDREKHRAERERREKERKRQEDREKDKEKDKRKEEKPKSPLIEKLKKESPSTFIRKESPSMKKDSPSSSSPSIRPHPYSGQKPMVIKHAPSKTAEEKKPFSESDLSSPSTSYGSITPRTPLSLQGGSHHLSLNEIQRRIAALTDEDQVFRVASLLLSLPGTNLLPSKSSLFFDVDLSTVDPSLLSRLCEALS